MACASASNDKYYDNVITEELSTSIQFPGLVVKKVEFLPMLNLVPSAEIKLANGTIVNAEDWDAVLIATFASVTQMSQKSL